MGLIFLKKKEKKHKIFYNLHNCPQTICVAEYNKNNDLVSLLYVLKPRQGMDN